MSTINIKQKNISVPKHLQQNKIPVMDIKQNFCYCQQHYTVMYMIDPTITTNFCSSSNTWIWNTDLNNN